MFYVRVNLVACQPSLTWASWICMDNFIGTTSAQPLSPLPFSAEMEVLWSADKNTLNDFVFQFSTSKTAPKAKSSSPFEAASPRPRCTETLPFLPLLWGLSVHSPVMKPLPSVVEQSIPGLGLLRMCVFTRNNSTFGHSQVHFFMGVGSLLNRRVAEVVFFLSFFFWAGKVLQIS